MRRESMSVDELIDKREIFKSKYVESMKEKIDACGSCEGCRYTRNCWRMRRIERLVKILSAYEEKVYEKVCNN